MIPLLRTSRLCLGACAALSFLAGCYESTKAPPVFRPDPPQEESAPIALEPPNALSRFRRLTHSQWEKTVRDLLRLDSEPGLSADFRADPRQGGYLFDAAEDSLEIDQALWQSYQSAAAELAHTFVESDAALSAYLPDEPDLTAEDKARAFISRFGQRAYRRPLSAAKRERYFGIYELGTGAYAEQPGFLGGIRLVVETFLQSPHFLYRVEESTPEADADVIRLDGWERASRLSYFFWGTMPDAELHRSARDGVLDSPEGVRAQATRLAQDARARDIFDNFFEKILEVERYESIAPASDAFPEVASTLGESARTETELFIEHVLRERGGTLRDLLTSTTTYVDASLAAIYGLEGDFDADFQEVELDPKQRRGVLTQVGFLASHATSRDPDPIHRGVFVARRVSCLNIAAPPDDIPPLPGDIQNLSNRQLVERHTEAEGTPCRNCHKTVINPYGFAFEHYDATGAYRTVDGEHEVDAQVEAFVGDALALVDGALELSEALAEAPEVHECFAGHLLSYAFGRSPEPEDAAMVSSLAEKSFSDALPFADLMVEIATQVSFLNRPLAAASQEVSE